MQQVRQLLRYDLMPSLVIRRFMYLPDTRELTVEFVSGRRYVYSEVPAEDVEAFRSASPKALTSTGTSATISHAANSRRPATELLAALFSLENAFDGVEPRRQAHILAFDVGD